MVGHMNMLTFPRLQETMIGIKFGLICIRFHWFCEISAVPAHLQNERSSTLGSCLYALVLYISKERPFEIWIKIKKLCKFYRMSTFTSTENYFNCLPCVSCSYKQNLYKAMLRVTVCRFWRMSDLADTTRVGGGLFGDEAAVQSKFISPFLLSLSYDIVCVIGTNISRSNERYEYTLLAAR